MTRIILHWQFHITVMTEVAEGFSLQVVAAKTKVTKDQEINGVVQNVGIHVLLWSVSHLIVT